MKCFAHGVYPDPLRSDASAVREPLEMVCRSVYAALDSTCES